MTCALILSATSPGRPDLYNCKAGETQRVEQVVVSISSDDEGLP